MVQIAIDCTYVTLQALHLNAEMYCNHKGYHSLNVQDPPATCVAFQQSAVHCCIREVTEALYRRASDYVHFWTDPESQAQRAFGFGDIAGFPWVQGVINCMHVAIKAPARKPVTFLNRNGFYSLNVQLVCDHRKRVMQVYVCFPGSCHDSFIPCQSQVPLLFTAVAQIQGWILGDKGDTLQTWLLTPVRNLTSNAEGCYNACHGSTRATIEQAIGMLEKRFCFLDRSGGTLQYSPERVARFIAVCCALHKFVIQSGEILQDDERWEQETSSDAEDTKGLQHIHGEQRATDARLHFIAEHFHNP
ncbi:putative nuclease HARBI1 [Heterodontus francisci]|uniref:putative nuclease HARBI1 n=1 Tax=Heterodontus francisci TaxID=7792 RepID=UPI00355BE192